MAGWGFRDEDCSSQTFFIVVAQACRTRGSAATPSMKMGDGALLNSKDSMLVWLDNCYIKYLFWIVLVGFFEPLQLSKLALAGHVFVGGVDSRFQLGS